MPSGYYLTFTICLQYFALSLCYWCLLLSLLSSILICKNYIKLIIYGYLGSKDAGLWILMYSSHEQSAIWRELRIDESISGWLYPSYGLFIMIHQWTWLFLLQVLAFKPALNVLWHFFALTVFLWIQETLSWSGQSEQLGWLQYTVHRNVWIELRSVRYTFVKFKMIPNDCMETRTLFMINCSKMFDMCSMCHSLLNNNCNW